MAILSSRHLWSCYSILAGLIPILTIKTMAGPVLSFGAERGHDPDSKSRESWSKGCTPLSYAAEGGRQKEIELLIKLGKVNPDSKTIPAERHYHMQL